MNMAFFFVVAFTVEATNLVLTSTMVSEHGDDGRARVLRTRRMSGQGGRVVRTSCEEEEW